jgi:hypothetical protein
MLHLLSSPLIEGFSSFPSASAEATTSAWWARHCERRTKRSFCAAQKQPFAFTRDNAQCKTNDSEGHLNPFPNFLALPDREIGGRA